MALSEQQVQHDNMRKRADPDPAASPYIGKLVRCFFSRTGGSNGVVVGQLDVEKSKGRKLSECLCVLVIGRSTRRMRTRILATPSSRPSTWWSEDGGNEVMSRALLASPTSRSTLPAWRQRLTSSPSEDADIDQDEAQSYKDELHADLQTHVAHQAQDHPLCHPYQCCCRTRQGCCQG